MAYIDQIIFSSLFEATIWLCFTTGKGRR